MITEVKFLPITPEFPSSDFLSKIENLLNNNIKYLIFRMNENEFSEDLLKETLEVVKKKNGKLIIHSKHLNLYQAYSKVHLSAKELMELDSKGFDKKLIGASCHSSEELKSGFSSTISYLQELGHRLLLVGDIPRYNISPEDCKYGQSVEQLTHLCSVSMSQFKSQLELYESTLRELSNEYLVPFIPIHEPLCSTESCSMIGNNEILYRDRTHLNIPGSRLIGRYLSIKVDEFRQSL